MPSTRRLRTVTLSTPMCPDMRMPLNTREGNDDEPIEPGIWNIEPCDLAPPANLCGIVAIFIDRLALGHNAGAGLQHRDRVNVTLVIEQLRHADFFPQNSTDCHIRILNSASCRSFRPGVHRTTEALFNALADG